VRAIVEGAEERGYVEPAEIEAFAAEVDLADDEVEELTRELERIGLEVGPPAAVQAGQGAVRRALPHQGVGVEVGVVVQAEGGEQDGQGREHHQRQDGEKALHPSFGGLGPLRSARRFHRVARIKLSSVRPSSTRADRP